MNNSAHIIRELSAIAAAEILATCGVAVTDTRTARADVRRYYAAGLIDLETLVSAWTHDTAEHDATDFLTEDY